MKQNFLSILFVCVCTTTLFAADSAVSNAALASTPSLSSAAPAQDQQKAHAQLQLYGQCEQYVQHAVMATQFTPAETAQMVVVKTHFGPARVLGAAFTNQLEHQVTEYGQLDEPSLATAAQVKAVLQQHLTVAGHPEGLATKADVQEVRASVVALAAQMHQSQQQQTAAIVQLAATVEQDKAQRAAEMAKFAADLERERRERAKRETARDVQTHERLDELQQLTNKDLIRQAVRQVIAREADNALMPISADVLLASSPGVLPVSGYSRSATVNFSPRRSNNLRALMCLKSSLEIPAQRTQQSRTMVDGHVADHRYLEIDSRERSYKSRASVAAAGSERAGYDSNEENEKDLKNIIAALRQARPQYFTRQASAQMNFAKSGKSAEKGKEKPKQKHYDVVVVAMGSPDASFLTYLNGSGGTGPATTSESTGSTSSPDAGCIIC